MSKCSIKVFGWETWPKIQNYSRYAISEYGVVVRCVPMKSRSVGTEVRGNLSKNGYKTVSLLDDNGNLVSLLVHRLVALTYIGLQPSDEEYLVRHLDDNKLNNYYKNLSWGNGSDNTADAVSNGVMDFLGRNPNAKLSYAIADEIRRKYKPYSMTQKMLAHEYEISPCQIWLIIKNRIWI